MTTLKQTNLSERFEVAFNKIDQELKKRVKYHDKRFTVLVRQRAKRHQLVNMYSDELEQYAKLRNAIVHEKTELGTYIAEPHIDVVERIEKIAHIFTRPNYAMTIATKNVISFSYEDLLLDVIRSIKTHNYAKYPIYRQKECIGLMTTADIVKWMADHFIDESIDFANIKIMDILKKVPSNAIRFVDKSINIFQVEDIFENAHQKKIKLEAVIITENGNSDEKPLGLVTAWDLIEIDYTAD